MLDFNHSKTVQDLIIKINEDNKKIKDDSDNQIKTNTLKTKFLIQNGVPIKYFNKSLIKKKSYDFGKNEMNNIEITEILIKLKYQKF